MNLSSIIDWMDLLIFVLAIFGTIGVIYSGVQIYKEDRAQTDPPLSATNINPQSLPNHKSSTHQQPVREEKIPLVYSQPEKLVSDTFVDQILEQALDAELEKKPVPPKPKTNKPLGFANTEPPKKKNFFLNFWKKDKDNNQAELLGNIMPPLSQKKADNKSIYPSPELIPEKLTLRSAASINLMLKVKGNKLVYRKIRQGSYNELKIQYHPQPGANKADTKKNEYPTGNSLVFSINGENVTSKTYQFTVYYGDTKGNIYSQQIAGLGKEFPIVDQPQKVI